MAVGGLRSLAAATVAPVFVARGLGAGLAPVELAGRRHVRLVATPRHATVLLAVGRFPGELADALARVHDQLPHPRGVVWWGPAGGHDLPAGLAGTEELGAATVAGGDDPGAAVVDMHRAVCVGSRPTRPGLLRDAPPHPFEGRGDHGQGGEGMMGGVPFGRPMAMTGEDRDGLSLDRSTMRIGPFLTGMPAGLAFDVVLQGGVVQDATPRPLGGGAGTAPPVDPVLACFERARYEPVPVAELERARARHLLRWVGEACLLAGLPALAARVASAVRALGGAGARRSRPVARLARLVRRTGLPRVWSGVGVLPAGRAHIVGPPARAGGIPVDARQDDPAYRRLGFTVVTRRGNDARARLEQHLAEAEQALDLVAVAARHGIVHDPADPLEPPRAETDTAGVTDVDDALAGLGDLLLGVDWSDALVTLCSLDLGVERLTKVVEVGR